MSCCVYVVNIANIQFFLCYRKKGGEMRFCGVQLVWAVLKMVKYCNFGEFLQFGGNVLICSLFMWFWCCAVGSLH